MTILCVYNVCLVQAWLAISLDCFIGFSTLVYIFNAEVGRREDKIRKTQVKMIAQAHAWLAGILFLGILVISFLTAKYITGFTPWVITDLVLMVISFICLMGGILYNMMINNEAQATQDFDNSNQDEVVINWPSWISVFEILLCVFFVSLWMSITPAKMVYI